MSPPELAPLPAYQRYDCRGCGYCCYDNFTIIVTREEKTRILAQGWEDDPLLHGVAPFVPAGENYRLARREDGACVFLCEEKRCRIHAKLGEQAKPLPCRLYPFKPICTDAVVRCDLRFDCPAVVESSGRSIAEHEPAVKELLPLLILDGAPTPADPIWHGPLTISWRKAERITECFIRLIRREEFDFTRRMLGCLQLATVLKRLPIDVLDGAPLENLLEVTEAKVAAATAKDRMVRQQPSMMTRTSFRQLLSIYGREDRPGEDARLFSRWRSFLRMVGGAGEVPRWRPDFPTIAFDALEQPIGTLPDDASATLERYYRTRLDSLGFFGKGCAEFGYLDGVSALLLTYPATLWFARVYAAGEDFATLSLDSIERGMRIVNYGHGLSPIFHSPLARYQITSLCLPPVLKKLMIWYGT